jgi:hypothetical protein
MLLVSRSVNSTDESVRSKWMTVGLCIMSTVIVAMMVVKAMNPSE